MKLESPENPVQVMTTGEIKQHTMRLTPEARRKVFNMLSKPYSNPIAAVIRELSTNASDEHIKFNLADKPFDVHLPSSNRLWFSIRDYANGLSPEGMEDYCSYTHSDKTHSNDFNGCLGIGSKSPFAYTDAYTIISIHKGIKYAYSLFLGEDGIPAHTLNGQMDTDEPSGLEIQIPVKFDDISRFHSNASDIYEWFKVEPNFIGTSFEISRTIFAIEEEHYALESDSETHGVSIIMGQVAYNLPISRSDFSEDFTEYNRMGLHLFVDNGILEFEPGRERISKTRKNMDAIRDELIKVRDEMSANFRETIDKCDNYFDAMLKFKELSGHEMYRLLFGAGSGNKPLEYNGKQLSSSIRTIDQEIEVYSPNDNKKRYSINICEATHFIVDDSSRGGYAQFKRIDDHHSFGKYQDLILIKGEQSEIDDFLSEYGISGERVSIISTYPSYLEKVVRTVPLSDDVMIFQKHGSSPKRMWKKDPNFEFSDGGYYIGFNNYGYNRIGANGKQTRSDSDELVKYVNAMKYKAGKDVVLVGAKKSVIKDFIDSPDWIDIIHEVDSMEFSDDMNEHVSFLLLAGNFSHVTYDFDNPFDKYSYISLFAKYADENIKSNRIKLEDFDDDIQYIIENCREYSNNQGLIDYYYNIFRCKGISLFNTCSEIADTSKLEKICSEIDKKFPLFRHVSYSAWDTSDNFHQISKLIDYFNFLK